MASLRTIEEAPGAFVVSLFDDPTPRAFESFAATTQILPRELPATLVAPGLPAVLEFEISCWFLDPELSKYSARWNAPEVFAPFLQSAFAARLRVLRWGIHDSFLDDLARALDDHAPPAFSARVDSFFAAFERGDNGRWSHVIVRLETPEDVEYGAAKLRTVLDLAPERVQRITVAARPGLSLAPFDAEIAALRARFPDADVRLPPT